MAEQKAPLVELQEVKQHYPARRGPGKKGVVRAVDGVSLTLYPNETLGLVGESGCGKSTLARMLAGLEDPTGGTVLFHGESTRKLRGEAGRAARRRIQMVFQDPYASLNPRKPVYDILSAPLLYHRLADRSQVDSEVNRLLDLVELPRSSKGKYPHQFSGGQRQRIGIARALSLKPELLVCDEPVSALDVSIQAQILNLLQDLQRREGLAYLFIGHGLGAVRYISQRIAVMYLGRIVEIAPAKELFATPRHPYTKALCDAAPAPDPALRDRPRLLLRGDAASVNITSAEEITFCPFASRCPFAREQCRSRLPQLRPLKGEAGRQAACLRAEELRDEAKGKEGA